MARANTLFQIFLFPLFLRETRSSTFLKNNPTPRGNQLHQAYFLYSHHGMSDQNRWHSCEASKIKASGGFWGRFSKPQKFQFYRWHSVFEVKKRFSGSEMIEKISLLFSFLKIDKKVVPKYITIFWKNFFDKFWKGVKILKENVIKVLKVKPHEHPGVCAPQIRWKRYGIRIIYTKCLCQGCLLYTSDAADE